MGPLDYLTRSTQREILSILRGNKGSNGHDLPLLRSPNVGVPNMGVILLCEYISPKVGVYRPDDFAQTRVHKVIMGPGP